MSNDHKKENHTENETYNSNITKDDLQALGDKAGNLKTDLSDDELLKERKEKVDFAGKDLDVPGRDLPSSTTKKSLKDEENTLYGQGGSGNDRFRANLRTR